jgi:hypothetical protein
LKFNIDYAHDWDVKTQGEPDVVFMAWKGYSEGGEKAAIERAKSSPDNWIPHERSQNYPADYDAAKEQSRAVARRARHYRLSGRRSGPSADAAGDQSGAAAGERGWPSVKAAHDVSDEPRDPHGRWTDGGGEAEGDGGGEREHPGKGYSKGAWVDKHGVIHTSNVYDAQRALFEDRKVELAQPKQISTLIKRLGETAAEMAEHGEEAPVFNLCNVSIKGTNLFCADQIGIPRVEMPVIPAKQTKAFIKYLKKQGYDVEKGHEYAANLRATQSEISGAKVAASMARIDREGFYKRLIVSRDDYILDGHHTWAGALGVDARNNDLHDDKMVKVARVDISITKLIAEAEKWTGGKGKKPASQSAKTWDDEMIEKQLDDLQKNMRTTSAPNGIRNAPEYQDILDLGEDAIPDLIAALRQGRAVGPAMLLLEDIIHEKPFGPEDEGNVAAMIDAWLQWADDEEL